MDEKKKDTILFHDKIIEVGDTCIVCGNKCHDVNQVNKIQFIEITDLTVYFELLDSETKLRETIENFNYKYKIIEFIEEPKCTPIVINPKNLNTKWVALDFYNNIVAEAETPEEVDFKAKVIGGIDKKYILMFVGKHRRL